MADARFEEAIRLAFETSGTEGIKQAAGIIASMGDVSEETKAKAAALLDEIGSVDKSGAAVRQYGELSKSILDYQQRISAARAKVVELAEAVKASDAPTKAQQRELDKSRAGLRALVGEQQKQLGTLRALKTSLDAQGISTRSAAASQRDLAARTAAASANLRAMVSDLQRTRAADAALQASLAEAAAKSKAETAQYDAALQKVRRQLDDNKAAAKRGAAETIGSMQATSGAVGKLRAALAGLTAYFSFRSLSDGIKSLLGTGDQFEKFQKQLTNIYGDAAKGQAAFDWVKQFAKDTPLQLDQVMNSFIRLRNFGIDPMSGTLQAAVDQNAKLGGESERLERITLAMGQAFAKGKLQGDDIKQMIEAGVPVWQLLSEVTGKNVQQLQKLSQAGALGTDVMQAFFAQMGKDSTGAAADQMATLSGQFSNLQDNFQQFQDRVAKKGVLDYFKDQLSKLNDLISKMAADGRLDQYAQKVSDGIVRLAETVKSATKLIFDHSSAIKHMAQAYLGFKAGKIILGIGTLAVRLATFARGALVATSAARGLGVGLSVLRGAIILLSGPIGWAIAGLAAFAAGAKVAADATVEFALKHNEGAKKLREQEEKNKELYAQLSEEYGKRAKALEQYANVQVLAASQVAVLTAAERAAYKERLSGHQQYLEAQEKEAELLIRSGKGSEAWVAHLAAVKAALVEAVQGTKDFGDGAKLAAQAAAMHMSVAAVQITEQFKKAGISADETKQKMDEAFADFGNKTPEQIGDIAVSMAKLGAQSGKAGDDIRVHLHGALQQLSEEDLISLQENGEKAFVKFGVTAKEAAVIMDSTLQQALERLGVSADQWGMAGTDAGNANIRAFKLVATNASASAEVVEAAFNKALENATTADDAKAIGEALKKAGERGKVGFDTTERAVKAVQDRVQALRNALDPLGDDFAKLGIKSQRALDQAAAEAKHHFDNIVAGARAGQASMNDVRAAFGAYAKAQLDSVANAETWRKTQVQSALETQAAVLGVSDELANMGVAGLDAGTKTAQGAHLASDALQGAASAARDASAANSDAAASAQKYDEAAKKSGETAESNQSKFRPAAVALNGLSDALIRAYEATNRFAGTRQWLDKFNAITAEWQRQSDALNEQLAALNKQNAAYDEMAQRIETLRQQYGYLNDDQLRALAQAQQTLEDNQKRAEDAVRQKREEAARQVADEQAKLAEQWQKEAGAQKTATVPAGAGQAPQRVSIDLNVSATQQPGAVPAQLSPTDVQRIANEVVRAIGISRTTSNR